MQLVKLGDRERLLHMDALGPAYPASFAGTAALRESYGQGYGLFKELTYKEDIEPTRKEVALFS